ncbi:uncharacterized protein AMSG_05405 [Thecamonas trahens ATCC 50062]|uniref:Uncharacterized protein n=1 Tax=Thecamonas trahens ATCC 50062 TaxID=461836 RepID=A0A0L0DAN3_THETB|nr:hypothetical protein AMSG_05405 [Thecamonas trahens ATCC 50062]KNC49402.1 hypothetical protein AMSG_05405 [Thecamonas trahens ATCC 50062]|eukprot:XP_013757826.1 hypothetical protein AMSG_05405 [Thecamonas trahens ATCC 50062]
MPLTMTQRRAVQTALLVAFTGALALRLRSAAAAAAKAASTADLDALAARRATALATLDTRHGDKPS